MTIHLKLCKTQLKLKQSEERLENVLHSLQEVVWSAFLEPFEIIYLNPAVEAVYGLSPQFLIDSPQHWIDKIVEDDIPLVQKYFSGSPNCGPFELEYRVIGPNQRIHWLQCSGKVQLDELQQRLRVDGILQDITSRRLIEEKLVCAAQRDSLTHLANRAFFVDRLNQSLQALQHNPLSKIALLFIDLDGFKDINDSLGHSVGDELLIHVSQTLSKSIRPTDLVARLGGDEFTILFEDIHETSDVFAVCDRIQNHLTYPLKVGEHSLMVTASIGVVISSNLYICADTMLRDADIAMYEAKRNGKACYQVFSQKMYEQVAYKISLVNELRNALQKKELFLEYQPILKLESETLAGFEALLRWQHPKLGLIPPNEFIPLAEETNLINQIGKYVLKEACCQMQYWVKKYPEATNLTMSINVASPQLETDDFPEFLEQILSQTDLRPHNIQLEITETLLIKNAQISYQNLSKLKERGIRVSLDDFGTGYSSLSYLIKFPVDTLKIDRSFIDTMESNHSSLEVIRAIITLARILNMVVVAEGVEKRSQGMALKELGCDMVQGYLFSKPLSREKATKYIQQLSSSSLLFGSESTIYHMAGQGA